MQKYYKEYKWSNIFAMLRNQKLGPEICTDDFSNKLVVITGSTSGIGYAAARKYASRGAEILCINRNEIKSKEMCETLKNQYGVKCSYLIADFSDIPGVHSIGKQLSEFDRNIDVLIHNTGVYFTKKTITANNLDIVFHINYLSSFILNYYLKEKFIKQNSGRILFVNSEAHRFAVWGLHLDDLTWEKHSYSGLKSYGAAKTAQLLSMIKLQDFFNGSSVTVNAMHPGNVVTNSGQNNNQIYKLIKKIFIDSSAKPIEFAAEALFFLGVSSKLNNISGKFFNLTTEEEPAPPALDKDAAKELWEISCKLGGLN